MLGRFLGGFLAALALSSAALAQATVGGGNGGNPGPAANASDLTACVYNASAPTASSGQQLGFQCDANGNIKISGTISGGNPAASATGAAVPADAGYTGLNFGGNLIGWTGDTNGYGNVNVKSLSALVAGSAIVGKVGIDQTTPGTTNGVQVLTGSTTAATQATAANLNATVVGTGTFATQATVSGADPCFGALKSQADFESTTSGGSIITATSAKKAYICSITVVTSVAANVSIIEGTGSSVCTGGSPAGDFLNTGVTAANGAAFAANGGVGRGDGNATIFANSNANYNTCVLFTTSGTPQVNVHVSYVVQ